MSSGRSPAERARASNLACYDQYYDKPRWWFRLRYDTQIKRQTVLHLVRASGFSFLDQKVVEIGFGSGETLLSFDASCEICGVELARSAVDVMRARAASAGYRRFKFISAVEGLAALPTQHFDIAIASHVLEHVPDDRRLLEEMGRAVRPGGIAVVVVPINERYDDPNHLRRYTPESLMTLVESVGWDVEMQLRNEYLYHLVEAFYVNQYNRRWPVVGPMVAAAFNIPGALLPFRMHGGVARLMVAAGFKPRQVGLLLRWPGPDRVRAETAR